MEYKELTILFKDNPNSDDEFGGTHKVVFSNASITITGDYCVVGVETNKKSVVGKIYHLNTIISYIGKD